MARDTPAPRTTDLDGPFSWVDHGGPDSGQVVVAVHGLGGSHANWHDLGPLIARHHRVLAVDLAGHGRTPRSGRSAGVRANCELLGRFLEQEVGRPVVLLGNSMGAAISILHAASHPEQVVGLALLGPALPRSRTDLPDRALARQVLRFALPAVAERTLARRRARLGPESLVDETLVLTCADPSRVSSGFRQAAVELAGVQAADPDFDAALLEAGRSLGRLVARAGAYRSILSSVSAPGIVLQGTRDRLVPPGGVRQLAALQPSWAVHLLDDVGHVPQVEDPALTAELLLPFLDSVRTRADLGAPSQLAGAS